MAFKKTFFAYPAGDSELVAPIENASKLVDTRTSEIAVQTWPQLNNFGLSIVAKHLGIHNPQQGAGFAQLPGLWPVLMDGEPRQAALLIMSALPEPQQSKAAEIVTNSRNRRERERRIVEGG
jgi:hypothetical protein